jgi:nucleoside-diphosphate-sugar epimerase
MNQDIDILKEILVKDAKKVATSLDFKELESKSIIVTGANGLIGINFIVSLIEIATKVLGINIYPVIHSSTSLFLTPFLNIKGITVYKGDLTDDIFLASLPKADIIIHAAGSGIPEQFLKNKLTSLKINTTTTLKLIDKLNIGGRFLFISSSDLYNGLTIGAYTEDQIGTTNTNHPRACYIEGKRTGETICNIFQEMGISAYAVRLSLTYGPGVSYGDSRVLPTFIRKALDNGQIDMLDSGEATRTFCYVSDAIELMWFVLLNGKYSLYNISGTKKYKIKELANHIGNLLNVPIHYPKINKSISGAPQFIDIDIKWILDESKKQDFVDLNEGLTNTINWFKHQQNMHY